MTEIAFENWCEGSDSIQHVHKNGDKGDAIADGTSKNIDGYSAKIFEALIEYCSRNPELKWGFVRAVGFQLYISNIQWSEYMFNHSIWEPIDEVI